MTLDVRPSAVTPPQKLQPEVACPMCPHREETADKMEEHVNRIHFDLTSPADDRAGQGNEDATDGASGVAEEKFRCPLCHERLPTSVALEQHVNRDHAEILSPMSKDASSAPTTAGARKRTRPDGDDADNGNAEQECPVCEKKGFVNANRLAEHVEQHFLSPEAVLSSSKSMEREGDLLLAQELERRERERRRHEEQRSFEALQAQYGMAESSKGGFEAQSISGMQRAVFNGQMSVGDYYERQIEVRQAEREGADDGRSVTSGLMPAIERASGLTRGVARTYLCSGRVDHHAASFGDRGWGCGYRNLQMLLSSLASSSEYAPTLAAHGISSSSSSASSATAHARMPSISRLQAMIEAAWERGFDAQGREQLGGMLRGTKKWIGATEIVTFLASVRIKSEVLDFHRPTANDGSHPQLFSWVANHFRSRVGRGHVPPLYLQHQGHSRTIVGVEVMKKSDGGNGSGGGGVRLLVFDPSNNKMANFLTGNDAAVNGALKQLRKNLGAIKSRQYQIVAVTGVYSSDEEAARQKVIVSTRIP